MLSGRLMPCSDMLSTWANAKTNWPSRCADAHLMLTSFDPRKAGPTDLRRRHRRQSPVRSTLLNFVPRRLLSALTATSLFNPAR